MYLLWNSPVLTWVRRTFMTVEHSSAVVNGHLASCATSSHFEITTTNGGVRGLLPLLATFGSEGKPVVGRMGQGAGGMEEFLSREGAGSRQDERRRRISATSVCTGSQPHSLSPSLFLTLLRCFSKIAGTDLRRPTGAAEVCFRVREQKFPYFAETSSTASTPQVTACTPLM